MCAAAWRLVGLPAGQWLIGELVHRVDQCLTEVDGGIHAASRLCRPGRLTSLGAALRHVDHQLTSSLHWYDTIR